MGDVKNKALFHKGGKGASNSSSKPVSRVLFLLAQISIINLGGPLLARSNNLPVTNTGAGTGRERAAPLL